MFWGKWEEKGKNGKGRGCRCHRPFHFPFAADLLDGEELARKFVKGKNGGKE